jgi:hypothetical protein
MDAIAWALRHRVDHLLWGKYRQMALAPSTAISVATDDATAIAICKPCLLSEAESPLYSKEVWKITAGRRHGYHNTFRLLTTPKICP